MANELRGVSSSGFLYARIANPAGLWWNGASFEAYNAGNYASYPVTLTEQGDSGVYFADFPAAIAAAGTYEYFVHFYTSSPAEGDEVVNTGKVDWTGTGVSVSVASGMSGSDWRDYVLRKGFKRTDKDTELFEATTDAIEELRRQFMFDEAEVDAETTDTISVLGDFRLDIESDLGLLLDVILQDSNNAIPLIRKSKGEYDGLYPWNYVDPTFTGYPKHFCVYAGQIYIGPIPDRTSYTYRLNYSRRGGTVTSSTTGIPFTNFYRDVLVQLVLSLLYDGLDEPDKAGYYRQQFEAALVLVKRRENANSGLSAFNVVQTDF